MKPQEINPSDYLPPFCVEQLQQTIGIKKDHYTLDEIRIALEKLMPADNNKSIWDMYDLYLLEKYTEPKKEWVTKQSLQAKCDEIAKKAAKKTGLWKESKS